MSLSSASIRQAKTTAELQALLQECRIKEESVLPIGRGSRLARVSPSEKVDCYLSSAQRKAILRLDKEDQTCEVEAGISPQELNDHLHQHHLGLGLFAPCHTEGTLGGLFMSPDHSLWQHIWGPARDQVLGAQWMLADGSIVRSGARVVKSVAGYDVTRLFLGSRGHLALCLSLILRLRPLAKPGIWHYLEPLSFRERVQTAPQVRSQIRCAFSLPMDEGIWACTSEYVQDRFPSSARREQDAGEQAVQECLRVFSQASHQVVFSVRRSLEFLARPQPVDGFSAYDWMNHVAAWTPMNSEAEVAMRRDSTCRVLPHLHPSTWLRRLQSACAPSVRPFGGQDSEKQLE